MRFLKDSDKSFYRQKYIGNPAGYTPKHLRILKKYIEAALSEENVRNEEDWWDCACESAVYNAENDVNP